MLNEKKSQNCKNLRLNRLLNLRYLMLFCVVIAFVPRCFAEESNIKARDLHYEVFFAMDYLNEIEKPRSAKTDLLQPLDEVGYATPKTYGLKLLKAVFSWEALSATKLNLVLRPDALNRKDEAATGMGVTQEASEFDSRAGDVYKPAASVRFLDAYQISTQHKELSLAVGVWEDLGNSRGSYVPLTQFGLMVMLPQKFSGICLGWNKFPFVPSSLNEENGDQQTRLSFEVFVIQGDQDRAESLKRNDETYDVTPTAKDPYFGGGAYVGWQPFKNIEFGILSGVDDSKAEGVRKQEVFGQGVIVAKSVIVKLPTKIDFDARYARETWQTSGSAIAPLSQQSASLSSSSLATEKLFSLVGIHMGRSERHRNYDPTKVMEGQDMNSVKQIFGYQLEAGFKYVVSSGLDVEMLISREFREETDAAGQKQGAFGDEGDKKHIINRLGLELAYVVGK